MKETLLLKEHKPTSQERLLKAKSLMGRYGMLLILIGLIILMSILSPTFFTTGNILNIIRQMSVVGIVAIGVTMIIITTGIDLSSGSVIALTSVIVASMSHPGSFPLALAILVGLAIGAGTGLISGTIIAKGRIAPFIVTLGMMTAARGAALLFTGGKPVGNLSDPFKFIGQGNLFGLPMPILIFFVVALVSYIILNNTKFGKYIYAIGGNEQASLIAGVNVDKYKILIYAIAAAVIGGTSLSGGIGTIGGAVIGALIIGVMNNGLDLMNVSSYWQQILKGAIITIAVFIDSKKNKKK
jgi:inositol transport system permease protein